MPENYKLVEGLSSELIIRTDGIAIWAAVEGRAYRIDRSIEHIEDGRDQAIIRALLEHVLQTEGLTDA